MPIVSWVSEEDERFPRCYHDFLRGLKRSAISTMKRTRDKIRFRWRVSARGHLQGREALEVSQERGGRDGFGRVSERTQSPRVQ